jgi:dTDP-4-dehydrorhamnose reductase
MIYISTDAVFDGLSEKLYKEDDEVNPLNIYGKTKYEGETYVLRNTKNVVLRTNIYGYNILDKNSFGEWILSALRNGETISMFDDIYFSPILVNELALIMVQIIEKDLCGLFHICGSGSISKYDFGLTLKEIFGIKQGSIIRSNSENFNFKAKRSKNMGMSNDKITKDLNISISSPIESIKCFKRLYEENYPQILKNMRNAKNEN